MKTTDANISIDVGVVFEGHLFSGVAAGIIVCARCGACVNHKTMKATGPAVCPGAN